MSTPRRRYAQIHLPPLDVHEARLVIALCEKIIDAVWRAHGEALAEYQATPAPPELPAPAASGGPAADDLNDLF
jgi:hypothetical protein